MVRKINEGFLMDLFDAATQKAEIPSDANTNMIDDFLEPMDIKDLYDMVVTRIREVNGGGSDLVKTKVAPLFFPKNKEEAAKAYTEIRESDPKNSKMSENMHPKLYKDYQYKLQNVLIEFCTTDTLDIIRRVQTVYKQKDENVDVTKIPAKVYIGTILKELTEKKQNYDVYKNLHATYYEYIKQAKLPKWQYTKEDANKDKDKDKEDVSQEEKDPERIELEDEVFEKFKNTFKGKVDDKFFNVLKSVIGKTEGDNFNDLYANVFKIISSEKK